MEKSKKHIYSVTVEVEVDIWDDEYFNLTDVKKDIKRILLGSSIGGMVSVRPKKAKNIKRIK